MASRIIKFSVTAQSKAKHTASVIFMHGSGGTGVIAKHSMKMILGQDFSFPHIKVIYPTAPLRPYTLCDGLPQHVWFDRLRLSLEEPEDLPSIEFIANEISKMVDQEVNQGVDIQRVFLGGFSMGSSLAMQMGYRFRPDIGGVFVCSSFLSKDSKVYEVLDSAPELRRPPLFMCHGDEDCVVPLEWGEYTFKQLKQRGVPAEFHIMPRLNHAINANAMKLLQDWLLKNLPDA